MGLETLPLSSSICSKDEKLNGNSSQLKFNETITLLLVFLSIAFGKTKGFSLILTIDIKLCVVVSSKNDSADKLIAINND